MALKVGQTVDLQLDKRFQQLSREYAIGDVYDALAELITNADDSYSRLFHRKKRNRDGGDILVEYLEQRKGRPCQLIVRDKAEGMDSDDMEKKLAQLGAYSSEPGNRGFMGRGAKDCTALGTLTYESIKDDRYYRCRITPDLRFTLEVGGQRATPSLRAELGVGDGNGTSVSLALNEGVRLPRFQTIASELPWYFSLRDIMSRASESRVLLRRADRSEKVQLLYTPPEGRLVINESYEVPDYPGASARLLIWRAKESLEDYRRPRFEKSGVLVVGVRAVHECTLLSDDIKSDPNSHRYFGRLECAYLDDLMQEYEEYRSKGTPLPPSNPRLLLDPNRRTGLDQRHPFIRALFQVAAERLRGLLVAERERSGTPHAEIGDLETKARLAKLAKLAGRFMRDRLEELEEVGMGEATDDAGFAKCGVLIYPTYLRLGLGQERWLSYYVKRSVVNEGVLVSVECDSPGALQVLGSPFAVHPHRIHEDRLVGTFRIKGLSVCDTAILTARADGVANAEAAVKVADNVIEDRTFHSLLEFEHSELTVKVGSRRSMTLFARYPDLVITETPVSLSVSDADKVVVRGRCTLRPVAGANFAYGEVVVEGRALGSKVALVADVHGEAAKATIRVVDRPEADRSIPIDIRIVPEDFGNFRARWVGSQLQISARHSSLSRYLGSEEDGFPGQTSPIFRLLLAEIVAESVCRKLLDLEVRQHRGEFQWAELKEPYLILEEVLAQMQRRFRALVSDAHKVMLTDTEVKALTARPPMTRAQGKLQTTGDDNLAVQGGPFGGTAD